MLTQTNRLEEPCREHVHGDPNTPHEANGHGLTTTSQLLYVCGHELPHSVNTAICSSYNSAPGAMLARLLSLSPDLASQGEVTPVQAWNDIRRRPHYGGMNAQTLKTLAEKLRDAVKCHG